ncbi:MAG: DUF6265 family protein [Burkholderiales bacterium]|jgi:hypothetical protein|nr:DUF6265 family protein [Burkholderiales bacterium]
MSPFAAFRNSVILAVVLSLCACASTQQTKEEASLPTHPPTAADIDKQALRENMAQDAGPLQKFAWLEGCWKGNVNQRHYREHWLPLHGNMLLGASHTVYNSETQDYQFLRIEPNGNDIFYVIAIPDEKEHRFKFIKEETDGKDTVFAFSNVTDAFPQIVSYRRATEGWMYIHVEGTLNGQPKKVIYPIRRVDCGNDEFLSQ